MVDMQIENDRVARLHMRRLGEDWIRAIADGAPERVEQFCRLEVTSSLLTPSRLVILDSAANLVAKLRQWFGKCGEIQVENSRVDLTGERLGIFYRLLLEEQGAWKVVEQQLYCTLQDGRIAQLHLLCSGFQPVDATGQAAGDEPAALAGARLLVIRTSGPENGSTCALLTPAIKTKLREMASGQVLEVRVDDPDARGDIEAWCRLSGNRLVKMDALGGRELRFFVEKK